MLKINGLRKSYGSFNLDCSIEVKAGHITALIGQNGAGKSTAFKAVLGLIKADGGEIKIFGKDASALTVDDREDIGVVLSDSGFGAYLTVKDVECVLGAMYKNFDRDYFRKQLERFNLPYTKPIREFSTGMKAKFKLTVALSHRAKLLVLDEPTVGLDVVSRDELLLLLREFMEEEEERAILISSHISSDLEVLCDDIYMIEGGRIVLHGDTDVLLGDYAILKADAEQFASLDRRYLLYTKREAFGFSALTDQKQYYFENYPSLTVEQGSVDGIITMILKGEKS